MKFDAKPSPSGTGRIDPRQVIAALGPERTAQAFADLGIEWNDRRPNAGSSGWKECHAIDRDDMEASAAVNVRSGYYTDRKPGRKATHLFQFAMEHQPEKFPRWIDAARHYAELAGLTPGKVSVGKGGRITEATFDYLDASGKPSYRVFRYRLPNGKKRFSQHPILPSGQVKIGDGAMDGVQPLPFGLPELLRSCDEPVFVVEGEGKVQRLRSVGRAATSAHGGCQSFKQTWAKFRPEWFAGRSCVLLPDCSDDGRAYMELVAGWLRSAGAASVKVVDLPDLATDQDVIQWLDQGGTPDELDRMAREVQEWEGRQAGDDSADEASATATVGEDRQAQGPEAISVRISDVVPVPIEWLIPNKVPFGKITLLAGQPGLGKSFLTIDLISRVTTGGEVPGNHDGECIADGSVVLLSAEDDLADTIRPRLDSAGADTTRVHVLTTMKVDGRFMPFDLSYLASLESLIVRIGDVKLLVVDPVASYVGTRTDDHRNNQLRGVMEPLAEMAARLKIAVLVVTHLNKGTSSDSINRVTGSMAYVALARAAWLLIRDPDDHGRRLFLSIKNNLAPEPWGLAFRIIDGRISWEDDPVRMTANDALRETSQRDHGGEAQAPDRSVQVTEWLQQILADGAEVASETVFSSGRAKGFSKRSLFEAKERLGIRARPGTYQGKWTWALPPQEPADVPPEAPIEPDRPF